MYTLRENAMAIYNGEQPDFYGDITDAFAIVPDPIFLRDMCPQDGELHKDSWGVTKIYRPDDIGETPYNNKDEYKAIKDIDDWREELVVPPLDNLDWSQAEAFAKNVNREEKFVCYFNTTGLFERAHFLMGMTDAFMNYMSEPEEMFELLKVIKDYKIENIRLAEEHLHPDIIFYQDDWGSKQNLFLRPSMWRELIKPLQQEISDAIHEAGMIYMHHSDCYCQPIVRDMVEIGIDIWQGVIPENDIPFIQKDTRENCAHQLRMQGGIDTPKVDKAGLTEEFVRESVDADMDRCLPGGYFYMGCPGGRAYTEPNNTWVQNELRVHGREYAVEHPIGGKLATDDFDAEKLESWYGAKAIIPTDNA